MSVRGYGPAGTVADSFFLLLAAGADRGGVLPAERAQGNLLVALGGVDLEKNREGTLTAEERAEIQPSCC